MTETEFMNDNTFDDHVVANLVDIDRLHLSSDGYDYICIGTNVLELIHGSNEFFLFI
jgi:hypothetical protein